MKRLLLLASLFYSSTILAQDVINDEAIYSDSILLFSPIIEMQATSAVNDMYNFKFKRAKNQFIWFQEKYPEHPLPYFLLGLNEWWQMMPNMAIETHDKIFFEYMDLSIKKARGLYKKNKENIEASFFLAAAYAFKSRLHAERKHWRKAVFNGKSALNFLKRGRELNELSPELKFGDALYNYYSVWIPQNYPMLKPVLLFFKKGDQALGLKQLEEVAQNAFYTRTEAQYFLMRIYRSEEKKPGKALPIAEYLHETFPDNPYFHRYYATILYSLGKRRKLEAVSKEILKKIDNKQAGYEAISGRYAAYYLGYLYNKTDWEQAEEYFQKTIEFSEETKSYKSGYYLSALVNLARIAHQRKRYKEAKSYYALVKEHAKRKNKYHKEARRYLKDYKKY